MSRLILADAISAFKSSSAKVSDDFCERICHLGGYAGTNELMQVKYIGRLNAL